MKRYDAMRETYEQIEVLGKEVLFTDIRLDRDTVPKELYMYEVRHDDEGWAVPVEIAQGILVNHFGTILSSEQLNLQPYGYLKINPEMDWNYSGKESVTINDFMSVNEILEVEELEM